ncbi:MAG: hypothetical protein IJH39_06670 [Clostridia bacterium]|nr:hypothetical protein [Clostridia bacterium]
MVTKEFAEASAEVNEILKYFPKSKVEKIPLKLRGFFEKSASRDYIVKIDSNKTLDKQENIKEKTKDLMTIIYRNYWCNEEERKELDKKLIENDIKYEEELKKKYNPNDIFKNNVEEKKIENNQEKEAGERENNLNIVEQKESIFKRLINKIRNIFHK